LPTRLIKMFSFVGDTVLDPFAGSATTARAAMNLERNSVGYEINPAFVDIMREKLSTDQSSLWNPHVAFARDTVDTNTDWRAKFADLPYVFRDPVQMQRKVDPKKMQFGSKLDANAPRRDDFHYVKKVTAADRLVLNNEVEIRLLGVKTLNGKAAQAKDFIARKTKGKKVFLRFDREKYDGDGKLLCYLYLSDRTFINAHLIKRGLAVADTDLAHRHASRFLKYQSEVQNG